MAQFQVPQFIDTESRIVGPFTLKQFIYLGIGGVIIFMLQYFVSLGTLVIVAVPIAILSAAFAFLKIDTIPLPYYIVMALSYALNSKRYIYQKPKDEYLNELLHQNQPESPNTNGQPNQ